MYEKYSVLTQVAMEATEVVMVQVVVNIQELIANLLKRVFAVQTNQNVRLNY